MDEVFTANTAELRGCVVQSPRYSHESRGLRFFVFPLEICRLSGTADVLNIVVREDMADSGLLYEGSFISVLGELRSFNNRSGTGNRLVLTVLAKELFPGEGSDDNRISLTGTVCKPPSLRITPMGREICDIILAVPRKYRRSDYIPVITWGRQARDTAESPVGTRLTVRGRLQSRAYTKVIDGQSFQRRAFEVSAADIYPGILL